MKLCLGLVPPDESGVPNPLHIWVARASMMKVPSIISSADPYRGLGNAVLFDAPRCIYREPEHAAGSALRCLPKECAVEIRIDRAPFAVMMASPSDLTDLVRGFVLSEAIVDDLAQIDDIVLSDTARGIVAAVTTVFGSDARSRPTDASKPALSRGLPGRSGCGLCGVRTLKQAIRIVPQVTKTPQIATDAVFRALDAIRQAQPLHDATRAIHAAAWCDGQGKPVTVREDVGRHNALDKLIGACGRGIREPGFCVITSRCSYEMVQKAARADMAILVAVSAPTSMALSMAREADITLVANAKPDRLFVFNRPDRLDPNAAPPTYQSCGTAGGTTNLQD